MYVNCINVYNCRLIISLISVCMLLIASNLAAVNLWGRIMITTIGLINANYLLARI